MHSIYKTILGILIMVLILYVGMGVLWANNEAVEASSYLNTVGDEISCANLRQNVIDSCVEQAAENNYLLTYEVVENTDGTRAYVVLTLSYKYTVSVAALSGWHQKTLTVY